MNVYHEYIQKVNEVFGRTQKSPAGVECSETLVWWTDRLCGVYYLLA
jgi:hypothetical protein